MDSRFCGNDILKSFNSLVVIPGEVKRRPGIQECCYIAYPNSGKEYLRNLCSSFPWIPAYAGMTLLGPLLILTKSLDHCSLIRWRASFV